MASKSKNVTPPTTKPAAPRITTPASAEKIAIVGSKSPARQSPSRELVEARAYALWEAAGRPECDGVEFWLEAEKQLAHSR